MVAARGDDMREEITCREGGDEGILVIMHGLNEHRSAVLLLVGNKYQVWGHGGSDGLHGYVPSLDWIITDIDMLLEKIKLENPGVPCFLFGHSTGGALVLKAALVPHIKAALEGVILTRLRSCVKPAHAIVGKGIPVSKGSCCNGAKYSDPLVYTGPIRVRTGHEILRISSYLMQHIGSVTIPFMVLHGTADKVTDPLASQDLYNGAPSKHKDIRLYDGLCMTSSSSPSVSRSVKRSLTGWKKDCSTPKILLTAHDNKY
ncbi:hypothetical protein HPP92_028210 [Vanilla planifolia]|uniref:Serine aminopeptidase S33 domain-containing protein n=1 Tax=Vanilla planifolia TaxID=51239 RepID=A0A835U694_VANPL|nr:hypothetical protein HPP92_028210 [Vanilla planifolia]